MIKLDKIIKIYNPKKANEYEALHGVSCEISDGEMVAIIGKSGAGKSTLLHILACIDSYQSGEYTIDGTLVKNLSEGQYAQIRNEKIGIVMQDFALVEDFSALENVLIPLDFAKKKIKNKKEKALEALKAVGMGDLSKKPCNKLSGGQKQRVAIAGILAMHPSIIILDEATSMLDPRGKIEINNLVHELNKTQNMTILSITHDIEEAALSDHVVLLDNGHIIDEGTPEKVLTQKEKLERIGLDVPFAYKISKKLHDSGYPIKPIINKEKLVKELCQLNLKK